MELLPRSRICLINKSKRFKRNSWPFSKWKKATIYYMPKSESGRQHFRRQLFNILPRNIPGRRVQHSNICCSEHVIGQCLF